MKHLFIINSHSFNDNTKLEMLTLEIKDYFKTKTDVNFEIYKTEFPRDALIKAAKFTKKLSADENARIYAIGGDGILFDCLNGLIENKHNVSLAALPYGSVNEYLHSFANIQKHSSRWKIDDSWRNIEAQVNSETIPVDIIKCNNNYALNYCAMGVEPSAHIQVNNIILKNKSRKNRRFLSKIYTIFRFLQAFRALAKGRIYKVTIDGKILDGRYIGINIANGNYYGYDRRAIEGTVPNDGKLDVLLIKNAPFLNLFFTYSYYTHGQWLNDGSIFMYSRAEKIEISSDEPMPVMLDGEVFYEKELNISIMPAELNLALVRSNNGQTADNNSI